MLQHVLLCPFPNKNPDTLINKYMSYLTEQLCIRRFQQRFAKVLSGTGVEEQKGERVVVRMCTIKMHPISIHFISEVNLENGSVAGCLPWFRAPTN